MLNVISGLMAGGVAASTNSYESISTVTVGSGGVASVSFSSIPSTYKHLQIRAFARSNRTGAQDQFTMTINSDTTSNYYQHALVGDGSSAYAFAYARNWICLGDFADDYHTSGIFGVSICDVLDYANTNKYKTTRSLTGYDANGSGQVRLESGSWRSTSAITSLTIAPQDGTGIKQYSSFALYGIKG